MPDSLYFFNVSNDFHIEQLILSMKQNIHPNDFINHSDSEPLHFLKNVKVEEGNRARPKQDHDDSYQLNS